MEDGNDLSRYFIQDPKLIETFLKLCYENNLHLIFYYWLKIFHHWFKPHLNIWELFNLSEEQKREISFAASLFFHLCLMLQKLYFPLPYQQQIKYFKKIKAYTLLYAYIDTYLDLPLEGKNVANLQEMVVIFFNYRPVKYENQEISGTPDLLLLQQIYEQMVIVAEENEPELIKYLKNIFAAEIESYKTQQSNNHEEIVYQRLMCKKGIATVKPLLWWLSYYQSNEIYQNIDDIGSMGQMFDDLFDCEQDRDDYNHTLITISLERGNYLDEIWFWGVECIREIDDKLFLVKAAYLHIFYLYLFFATENFSPQIFIKLRRYKIDCQKMIDYIEKKIVILLIT